MLTLKQTIRRESRLLRQSIPDARRAKAAASLADNLEKMQALQAGAIVAVYFASDGEISLDNLIQRATKLGAICVVPVIPEKGNRLLRFAEVGGPVKDNRFGIPEPNIPPAQLYGIEQLDTVLVPLVAFDNTGNRLGMGGGYYDTTLAEGVAMRPDTPIKVIGVAHEIQRMEALETEEWDIPLDVIVTDQTIHYFT
jgi:5-formyltetrahydrofolate cyclo-ligase